MFFSSFVFLKMNRAQHFAWSRDQPSKLFWDRKSERTCFHIWKNISDIGKNVIWNQILYWEWEEDDWPKICQKFLWCRSSSRGQGNQKRKNGNVPNLTNHDKTDRGLWSSRDPQNESRLKQGWHTVRVVVNSPYNRTYGKCVGGILFRDFIFTLE
jgi:hypothetical protein